MRRRAQTAFALVFLLFGCSSSADAGDDATPGDTSSDASSDATFDGPASSDVALADADATSETSDAMTASPTDPFFGLSPDEATWGDEQAHTLRALGVGTVRFQFCDWPAQKSVIEAKVEVARKAGLHVYAELNYCTLYAPSDVVERQRYWHWGFTDAGNDFAWKFANAAGEIATYFAGRVERYEIWNEPDAAPRPATGWPTTKYPSATNADWDGACGTYDYGVDYGQGAWALCPRQLGVVTTNSYMKIKAADAAAKVVAGNLLFHGEDAWVAKEYWKQVERSGAVDWYVKNKGGGRPWDEIGIHPYAYAPDGPLENQLASFRGVVTAEGDGASKVLISEYGWSTTNSDPYLYASESDQAKYVADTFAAMRSAGLPLVMWFNYLSAPGLDFGIRRVDGSWKPAAKSYCTAAAATACPAP